MRQNIGEEQVLALETALREKIGLADDESLRLIHHSGHLLTFERSGATPQAALPWDRELVLTADVRAFPLADLMSLIHSTGKSGFLLFSHEDLEKSVFMHRGEVVFAASNQAVDRLGESLLRTGGITLEQLREADRRWSPNERFGKVLVEIGVLTPRDLWNAVKAQVEEIVRSLFTLTGGRFHFWEGDVQPDNIVRLALPTRRLIAEGLRRRDELFKFLAVLEDERVRVFAEEDRQPNRSRAERDFVSALEAEAGSFGPACRRAGIDPLTGARTVQLLKLVGAVKLMKRDTEADADGASGAKVDPDARVREYVYDHMKLMGELAAPIVAVEGPEEMAGRLARVLEEAAARHPGVLEGVRVGPGGAIDPEAILSRVLRLSGDRERAAADALGELVLYLEFELTNHPGIEGAESYLEAVEGLRAKLER